MNRYSAQWIIAGEVGQCPADGSEQLGSHYDCQRALKGKPAGMAWEQFTGYLASTTHPKRAMALDEVANVAVFVAFDKASGMTGTTVNLTMGSLDD